MTQKLEDQIKFLGLSKCEFSDECDFCDSPTGEASYCSIVSGEGYTETAFYICEKCIPEYQEKQEAEMKFEALWYEAILEGVNHENYYKGWRNYTA